MPKKSSHSVKVYYPRYDREELIRILKEKVNILKHKIPLKRVILFGSYAKGNYTAFSDIDLLIVYKGKYKDEYYKVIRKTINIRGLEIHMYSDKEYELYKDYIKKMIKGGIKIL